MKKNILFVIFLIIIFCITFLGGCVNHMEDEVVIGDFVCQEWPDNTLNLKNLSEEGKKKKYIVVPPELDGRKVDMLGYKNAIFSSGRSNWESENLEKLYINNEYIFFLYGLFDNCPQIKKFIIIKKQYENRKDYLKLDITTYMTSLEYQEEFGGDQGVKYFPNGELRWRGADVSYYYNYEESPNNGYYWLDDVEDGELIEFIPEEPTREGYKFEGWYKEAECKNKWEFEKDRVIKADNKEPYYENKLFAKWAKK